MMKSNNNLLSSLKVNKHDREYQIWKREPLSIELLNETMFIQKLDYIHYNPVRAGLCELPEDYHYSSARFYLNGSNSFHMLTHFTGNEMWVYKPVGQRSDEGFPGPIVY